MLFFYCFFGFFRNVETQIEEALSCFYVFMAYFCFMLFFQTHTHKYIHTNAQTHKIPTYWQRILCRDERERLRRKTLEPTKLSKVSKNTIKLWTNFIFSQCLFCIGTDISELASTSSLICLTLTLISFPNSLFCFVIISTSYSFLGSTNSFA